MDVESKRPNMGKTITAAIDPINKIGTSDLSGTFFLFSISVGSFSVLSSLRSAVS